MTLRHKLKFAVLFATLMLSDCSACRNQMNPTNEDRNWPLSSEPETYSATLVRLVENGEQREESTTRLACSGDMRREEWLEAGAKRALIFRPDLGKSFLLDLDNRLYIETAWGQATQPTDTQKPPPKNSNKASTASESEAPSASSLQTVASEFLGDNFEEAPTAVETRALPDEKIADRICQVREQSATFADGRAEITKTFRAESLRGLIVKTEMQSIAPAQRLKITIERRDIKLEVSADEFAVPAGFKKVQRFPVVKPPSP